jgi:CheY-like chemotaxis protein
MAGQHALDLGDEPLELLDDDGIASDAIAEEPPPTPPLGRLGGARADVVAALGRRIAELTSLTLELSADLGSQRLRDDLRRRIHALGAGARLLRFVRLSQRLGEAELALCVATGRGEVLPDEITALRAIFDQGPALAWGEASIGESTTPLPGHVGGHAGGSVGGRAGPASSPPRSRPVPLLDAVRIPLGSREAEHEPPISPQTALVVGSERLADALALDRGGVAFEVERAQDSAVAVDLARALAPDVVVIDADRPGARELCEALASDPLTEGVPVVVVGNWARPDDAAPFVALGAARTLIKPVSPGALRRACAEASATYGRREVRRSPLGELSVDELGARLAEELRRGLCDATVSQGRSARFDLGEGSEVLAALWGAVARIRDVVTIQSAGSVRFAANGPEGALPIAPWLGDGGERRAAALNEARAGAVSLDRKVVVVADDDPTITWFLSGVLAATGAVVHEAHDGARALEIAHRVTPDLVITDVVMPVLDGFALCRALKRDLVLRDVPVILLSWKEDLLQRVRELGGGADGYLRKEASAPTIVQRVREVMLPRRTVEERLARGGEVRGRLDGLTTRTLLGLACAVRPDSTVTVRDAAFLYEVDLRGGRPVRATRTSIDGAFQRGPEALSALLGVGAGRFVVAPASTEAISVELRGSLDEQLLPRLASARAAQRLLSGAELVLVERVELDEDRLAGYAAATPEPARSLLRTIAAGASPRALITSGQAGFRLLEDVLADAAAHGAVSAVIGAGGGDLLAAAVARELEIFRGDRVQRAPVTPTALDLGPIIYTSTPAPVEILEIVEAEALSAERAPPSVILAPGAAPRSEGSLELPALAEVEPAPEESRALSRVKPLLTLGSLTPPPVAPVSRPRPPVPPPPVIISLEETPSRAVRKPSSFVTPEPAPRPVAVVAEAKDAKPSRSMWGLFAVAGIVFAVGARLSREREMAPQAPPPPAPIAEVRAPEPAAAPVPVAAAPAALSGDGESKVDPLLPQEGPLRADDKVPPGQGMLEVIAGTSDTVWIDGTLVGNGPIVKRALAPKKDPYEIRVKLRGEERVRFVLVREGRLTRLRIAPPWSR